MFDTLCIVGVGLIGGSLGMAARERGLAHRVVGVARREETRREAVQLGAVDVATDDAIEAVRDADCVFLATPVGAMRSVCEQIAPHVRPAALITDGGSVKAQVVRECAPLFQGRAHFVGGHPMAGSEQSGVSAARADLFEGATWVITHTPETVRYASLQLKELVFGVGARPLMLSPEEHDVLVAMTSHLPHLVAAALVHGFASELAGDERARLLVGKGWRDTTRIAQGDPLMWRDICLANKQFILYALNGLIDELGDLSAALEADDVQGWLERAAQVRREQNP